MKNIVTLISSFLLSTPIFAADYSALVKNGTLYITLVNTQCILSMMESMDISKSCAESDEEQLASVCRVDLVPNYTLGRYCYAPTANSIVFKVFSIDLSSVSLKKEASTLQVNFENEIVDIKLD